MATKGLGFTLACKIKSVEFILYIYISQKKRLFMSYPAKGMMAFLFILCLMLFLILIKSFVKTTTYLN